MVIQSPPLARFTNTTVYRIIPSRFPPVDLFRPVAPAESWSLLQQISMRTNGRLVERAHPTDLIRAEDRIEKSSSNYIVGPLTRPYPNGSEFSDETFGVLYASLDFETGKRELIVRRERFLAATNQKPQRSDVRVILMDLAGELHDIRGSKRAVMRDISRTRALGVDLRRQGSFGIVFDSQANPGGTCIAVFRPPVLSNCRQERHLGLMWNGREISDVVEYTRELRPA